MYLILPPDRIFGMLCAIIAMLFATAFGLFQQFRPHTKPFNGRVAPTYRSCLEDAWFRRGRAGACSRPPVSWRRIFDGLATKLLIQKIALLCWRSSRKANLRALKG